MEGKTSQISELIMETAKNGVIISYTRKTKGAGKGTFDNYDYKHEKEVYDIDEDAGEDSSKAFDRFKELFKQCCK